MNDTQPPKEREQRDIIGTPEHAAAQRAWETEMRLMPSRERNRRLEIGQTAPDVLVGPKGDVDADVGYQGPQPN